MHRISLLFFLFSVTFLQSKEIEVCASCKIATIEKAIEAEEKEIVDEIIKEEQSLLKLFKR